MTREEYLEHVISVICKECGTDPKEASSSTGAEAPVISLFHKPSVIEKSFIYECRLTKEKLEAIYAYNPEEFRKIKREVYGADYLTDNQDGSNELSLFLHSGINDLMKSYVLHPGISFQPCKDEDGISLTFAIKAESMDAFKDEFMAAPQGIFSGIMTLFNSICPCFSVTTPMQSAEKLH